MFTERPTRLLILGLGNVLCGDDGLGVRAVHLVAHGYAAPQGVSILDGGTLGLSLLPHLEDAEQAILVDAIRADAPPGSLVRLEGEDVAPAVAARLSPHQVGVADLLDGARLLDRQPTRLVLLGLVPRTLELQFGCSPEVEARLPELAALVVREARRLGHPLTPLTLDEAPVARSPVDVGRILGM
jgi:hydrogenase maturation protease